MNYLYFKRLMFLLAILIATTSSYSQQTTIINYGSTWKWHATGSQPSADNSWRNAGYNETGWTSGNGRFGYGDPGMSTCVLAGTGCSIGSTPDCATGSCTKYWTTYFRTTFQIADISQISGFILNVIRDDGAVVYVNGNEVWRTGMPAGTIVYSTPATTNVSGTDETATFTSTVIPTTGFVNGTNTIAVELHQQNTGSSDMVFDLDMKANMQGTTVFNFGSTWKYYANTLANAPAANWNTSAYNDAAWASGAGQLGFGDDGEVTAIPAGCGTLGNPGACSPKFTTTYFRANVNIPDTSVYKKFLVNLKRDDGAVVYINGTEVFRSNIGSGPVSYSRFATAVVDEGAPESTIYTSPLIRNSVFQPGNNVIAVEIHQVNDASSDLVFDLQLQGINTTPSTNEVVYMWSGAITPNSAKVNAKLTSPTTAAKIVVSTSNNFATYIATYQFSNDFTADGWNNNMAAMSISGLLPNTKYYYAIASDDVVDNSPDDIGTFTTPAASAFSYKFTVGSCGQSSNHPVYTRMAARNPLFQMATGDLHYFDPNDAGNINTHRTPYEQQPLGQPASRNFFLNFPLAYIWDDHDYSGNDSHGGSAGRTNARYAFQEYVPHYPLVAGQGNVPIYQAFTIGRVRYILSDLRSERVVGGSMMGATQKAWFKAECIAARDNGQIIAWVTTVSLGGTQADNWGGFNAERVELANFFRDNAIQNMFILSGDAHMLAIDNGSNHDFSTGGVNPPNNPFDYPVFQAAALNQSGSTKGGVYSEGGAIANPNNTEGQYGLVEVTDAGGEQITIKFTGYRVNQANTVETQINTYTFTRTLLVSTPIKFSSFSVRSINNGTKAAINWKSEIETDCKEYIVERSNDGISFQPIAKLNCQGNSNRLYSAEDASTLNGWNYYRIKGVETTGKISYTDVKKVFLTGKVTFKLTPNPAKDFVTVNLANIPQNMNATYTVYNIKLRAQEQGQLALTKGANKITLPVSKLAAGTYILNIFLDGAEINQKFIKQ